MVTPEAGVALSSAAQVNPCGSRWSVQLTGLRAGLSRELEESLVTRVPEVDDERSRGRTPLGLIQQSYLPRE